MKPLVKVMLILGSLFLMTFVIGRLLGILTVENVKHWLWLAAQIDPLWLAAMVIILLCVDLFVAVPTLTITLLSGFFLGFPAGAMAAFTGMSLAAFGGYVICRLWGEGPVAFLVRDEAERLEMKEAFQRNGPVMILIPTRGKNDPYDRTFGVCGKKLIPPWSG